MRRLAVVPTIILALALAACGSGAHQATGQTVRTAATMPPSSGPSTTGMTSTSVSSLPPTSEPPAAAGGSTCTAADLTASPAEASGAGGHRSALVTLTTNRSPQPCTMTGYPGVELLDAHGATIVNAARGCEYIPCSTTAGRVTVAPGGSAYFELVWQDNPPEPAQSTCPQGTVALITPPNAYNQLHVPLQIAPCGLPPVFGVGTVQPGPAPAG